MRIKFSENPCFLAGDKTHLKELLHPSKNDVHTLFSLAHAFLEIGESSLPHRLIKSSETYFVLAGQGEIEIDGASFSLQENDTCFVRPNAIQSVRNTGQSRLEFLCIVSPPWDPADEAVYE